MGESSSWILNIEKAQPEDGSWQLTLQIPDFQADLTAQLNALVCGTNSMDYTSYGHVSVENVIIITATVQLDGPNPQPQVIDMVESKEQKVVIEQTNPTFQKLLTKVPQELVEASVYEFLHSLFTEQLQRVIETQLTGAASKAELEL